MLLIKLGGSVMGHWKSVVDNILSACRLRKERVLFITGGGRLADAVREMEADDDTSHWMAILAMEINSFYLSSLFPELEKIHVDNFEEIDPKFAGIVFPYTLIRRNDELPHTWDVTSDSIAIWMCGKLGLKKVIKITDVDGIFKDGRLVEKISVEELNFESCIDSYSGKLIREFGVEVFICNGGKPERVKDYILREKAIGTLITKRR
jgi:hypothetical protein